MSDDHQATTNPEPSNALPAGEHPLEIAARRGIGPLSPRAQEVWHGHAQPCVSCGLLVMRDQRECDHCGQDLSDDMIEKMKAHAGPWYVLEHLRPFPGVSLERIIRQIRRGVLTQTSIIRGPATDYQWRFAVETPGLCRYFGKCWRCQKDVKPADSHCPDCLAYLAFVEQPPMVAAPMEAAEPAVERPNAVPPERAAPSNLEALSAALEHEEVIRRNRLAEQPPRIFGIRAIWVAIFLLVIVVVALVLITGKRMKQNVDDQQTALTISTSAMMTAIS